MKLVQVNTDLTSPWWIVSTQQLSLHIWLKNILCHQNLGHGKVDILPGFQIPQSLLMLYYLCSNTQSFYVHCDFPMT